MSSGKIKQRNKSFSGLAPPVSSLSPDSPQQSPSVLKRRPSTSTIKADFYYNNERQESIEEEQHKQIQMLENMIRAWKTRWKQENEDKIRQLSKKEQVVLSQRVELQKKDQMVASQRSQLHKLAAKRDAIIKEKQSLEKCFRQSVQQHTLEKMELKKQIIEMAEEAIDLKQKVAEQTELVEELQAKMKEWTDANNNDCPNLQCRQLNEQSKELKKESLCLKLKLKEAELRDNAHDVLIETSLDRIRVLEGARADKPKRICNGGHYVMQNGHLEHTSDSSAMYTSSNISVSSRTPSGLETRSLGSLDSLESILEDRCMNLHEEHISPTSHAPLQLSRSTDLISPMLLSSPELDKMSPPEKIPLQRKGSLDFDIISPGRRKRSSGFDFLKSRHGSQSHGNDQPLKREGKRKRRTADFADLLRKIANGGHNSSGTENEKLHSQKSSKPKRGSVKH